MIGRISQSWANGLKWVALLGRAGQRVLVSLTRRSWKGTFNSLSRHHVTLVFGC